MDPRADDKRRQLERALEHGSVMIHLDARRAGVLVPARFHGEFHLRLNVSLRFDPPDLSVSDWGLRETLSFAGVRFAVAVPWSAIFAITGTQREDQAFLFPEDMPEELLAFAARHFGLTGKEVELLRGEENEVGRLDLATPDNPEEREPEPARGRSALRVVSETQPGEAVPDDPVPPKARPSHLKLVK